MPEDNNIKYAHMYVCNKRAHMFMLVLYNRLQTKDRTYLTTLFTDFICILRDLFLLISQLYF